MENVKQIYDTETFKAFGAYSYSFRDNKPFFLNGGGEIAVISYYGKKTSRGNEFITTLKKLIRAMIAELEAGGRNVYKMQHYNESKVIMAVEIIKNDYILEAAAEKPKFARLNDEERINVLNAYKYELEILNA